MIAIETNFREFAVDLNALSKAIEEEMIPTAMRKLALQALVAMLPLMRVDTGRMRASTNMSSGLPDLTERQGSYRTGQGVTGEELSRAEAGLRRLEAWVDIYIAIAVHYASYQNDGTDKIPGTHHVEAAQDVLRDQVLEIERAA